ncbi:MAG TPA: hypothetical protein VIW68_09135 [Candidatus Sulfotelmatobacter sp.]
MIVLIVLCWSCAPRAAAASATLLLEEPYGHLGFFTATGHAAVYFSGVCAESPLVLRPCAPGETGVVISRYDGVGGYDWVAIPLIPYLYAVERPEDIPLFADARMVLQLRDRYRRQHLEGVTPDALDGGPPAGNWYELVGSSYDRTIYGFTIETSPERDLAFIRRYNGSSNRSHFRLLSRNCADFAKDVINFYYPKALHRSVIADMGMTTPKQMAQTLIRFSGRHPELRFSRLVIPQIPGSMPRSTKVHGVVDSFFTSKKYIVPSAIASPVFAGCVFAVYVGSGTRHFDPAHDALVFAPGGEPDLPLGREDRRAYEKELEGVLAETNEEDSPGQIRKEWARLQTRGQIEFDAQDRPVLRMQIGERMVRVGISADNILGSNAPPHIVQELLEARLEAELHRTTTPTVSQKDFARDWRLLQRARNAEQKELAGSFASPSLQVLGSAHAERTHGNLP